MFRERETLRQAGNNWTTDWFCSTKIGFCHVVDVGDGLHLKMFGRPAVLRDLARVLTGALDIEEGNPYSPWPDISRLERAIQCRMLSCRTSHLLCWLRRATGCAIK